MAFNDTEYRRRRREEDPEYHERRKKASLDWKKRHVQSIRSIVVEAKNKPCVDCGVQYETFLMEFDHVRGTKSFNLSKGARRGKTVQQILDEIAKCDIRCVMCHRRRHFSAGDLTD